QAGGAAAQYPGPAAADPARRLRAGAAARAAAGPDGGGGLRADPAPGSAGNPAPRLLERARLAAATLAWCGPDPARDPGRRRGNRRVPDADGGGPGYRPGAAGAAHRHWRVGNRRAAP